MKALEGVDKLSSDQALPSQLLAFRANQTCGERGLLIIEIVWILKNGLYSFGEGKTCPLKRKVKVDFKIPREKSDLLQTLTSAFLLSLEFFFFNH